MPSFGSHWRRYRARFQASLEGCDLRVVAAFWLFGLINNIFYVLILSAALDLVGPAVPKSAVLLASIIPGLATKTFTPYVIHLVPYHLRIVGFVVLSTCGMLIVACSPTEATAASISSKLAGIVLANISSGAGEVNFLSLTHFYGQFSLAAWGSGTGGAGLLGAGAYALATTTFGFSEQTTLMASAVLPIIMLLSYFTLLPLAPLQLAVPKPASTYQPVGHREEVDQDDPASTESAGLLSETEPDPTTQHTSHAVLSTPPSPHSFLTTLHHNLTRARTLLIPYMLPLFLVYLAEYTINQSIAPTLLFPLPSTPFTTYRSFYPTYAAIYQLGVFLSRSSLPFIRVRALHAPALLQVLNLALLTAHALFPFLPSVWVVFAVVLWEGLLGGLVYVSTFAAVAEEVPPTEREFSLGAVTVSDSAGIFFAGVLGLGVEGAICRWQVAHGRDWCQRL